MVKGRSTDLWHPQNVHAEHIEPFPRYGNWNGQYCPGSFPQSFFIRMTYSLVPTVTVHLSKIIPIALIYGHQQRVAYNESMRNNDTRSWPENSLHEQMAPCRRSSQNPAIVIKSSAPCYTCAEKESGSHRIDHIMMNNNRLWELTMMHMNSTHMVVMITAWETFSLADSFPMSCKMALPRMQTLQIQRGHRTTWKNTSKHSTACSAGLSTWLLNTPSSMCLNYI